MRMRDSLAVIESLSRAVTYEKKLAASRVVDLIDRLNLTANISPRLIKVDKKIVCLQHQITCHMCKLKMNDPTLQLRENRCLLFYE